jgi:hypothetical protein
LFGFFIEDDIALFIVLDDEVLDGEDINEESGEFRTILVINRHGGNRFYI